MTETISDKTRIEVYLTLLIFYLDSVACEELCYFRTTNRLNFNKLNKLRAGIVEEIKRVKKWLKENEIQSK